MYIGRCACRKWNWKKVNDSLFSSDFDKQRVGTVRSIVKTSNPKGFLKEEIESLKNSDFFVEDGISFSELVLELKGIGDKTKDIERYNMLKAFVESSLNSADYAVLCVKKNPKTWSSVRCGKR